MSFFYEKFCSTSEASEKLVKKNDYTFTKVEEVKLVIKLEDFHNFSLACESEGFSIDQYQKDRKNNSCTIWIQRKLL
jgi:hypothetical protein